MTDPVVDGVEITEEDEINDEVAELDPEPTEGLDAEPDDDDAEIHPFRLTQPEEEEA